MLDKKTLEITKQVCFKGAVDLLAHRYNGGSLEEASETVDKLTRLLFEKQKLFLNEVDESKD